MLYTNLKLLRHQSACSNGISTLIASLPSNHSKEKLISLSHILKSNGLEHAIWAMRATTTDSRKIAAFMAIDFARQTLSNFEKEFPEDKRPRIALEMATAFLHGKLTLKEIKSAAWSAAESADSAWSAESAWSAAESAAESAWSAAESAWSARPARSARPAWSAAESAWSARSAWSAESAWSAARSAAESAWSAADSAAWSAAGSAAGSARSAARSAAESANEKIFKKWISKK